MEVGCLEPPPPPRRLSPGHQTPDPLHRKLGGPQRWSGRLWKISPPPAFDRRTVQSRNTGWATPAHDIQRMPYAISSGVRQEGHETDQSPPRAKVTKEWSYTSTPPWLHGQHRNFTVLIYISSQAPRQSSAPLSTEHDVARFLCCADKQSHILF